MRGEGKGGNRRGREGEEGTGRKEGDKGTRKEISHFKNAVESIVFRCFSHTIVTRGPVKSRKCTTKRWKEKGGERKERGREGEGK